MAHSVCHCMPFSSGIISEVLPEIHIVSKCDFLKPIILSHIINDILYMSFLAGTHVFKATQERLELGSDMV